MSLKCKKSVTEKGLHWILPRNGQEKTDLCCSQGCQELFHGCPNLGCFLFDTEDCKLEDTWKLEPVKYFKKLITYACSLKTLDLNKISEEVTKIETFQVRSYEPTEHEFSMFPNILPNLRTLLIPVDSKILKHLVKCPNLEEFCVFEEVYDIEVQKFLEQHPNAKNFKAITLLTKAKIEDLTSIAEHCPKLESLKASLQVRSTLDCSPLKVNSNYFKNLKTLYFKVVLNRTSHNSNLMGSTVNFVKLFDFLLLPALNIEEIYFDLEIEERVDYDDLFQQLIGTNQLKLLNKLNISLAPRVLDAISMDTFKMICDLPSLRNLTISSIYWQFHPSSFTIIDDLKLYAMEKNYDINLNHKC